MIVNKARNKPILHFIMFNDKSIIRKPPLLLDLTRRPLFHYTHAKPVISTGLHGCNRAHCDLITKLRIKP